MLRLLSRRRSLPIRRFSSTADQSRVTDLTTSAPSTTQQPPPSLTTLPHSLPSPLPRPRRLRSFPPYFIAGTLVSSAALVYYLSNSSSQPDASDRIYTDLSETLEKSKCSARRLMTHMKQTGAAAAVLWRSLLSVLTSANQGVRSGFELRVAALLADIAAANTTRRMALVGAGRGVVVDWLLEIVSANGNGNGDRGGTQAEAARALAHLVADPTVCDKVLGRPGAVPSLLRFIFSFQPKKPNKNYKHSSLDGLDPSKGRSMLVAALMDIITSDCDTADPASLHPMLSGSASLRDIASAIEVIEQGSIHFDNDGNKNDDGDDGDIGMKGIGMKVLGGTAILGFSPGTGEELAAPLHNVVSLPELNRSNSSTVPGLWDDLQREHVAVPFATWALANWALASGANRLRIQELDRDGQAVMAALTAPERTVKWHGSLVARALLDDSNLPLTGSVPDWSSSLLSTAFDASGNEDVSLVQLALSTFLVSVERCDESKKVIREKSLELMRGIAKQTEKNINLQEMLVRVLGLLFEDNHVNGTNDIHSPLSIEEGQRWSGILVRWIFDQYYPDSMRNTAIRILSHILEDCGPASVPISQGWLTLLLNDVLGSSKTQNLKGNVPPPQADKVKHQIDHFNASSATQIASQLASAVVRQAGTPSEPAPSDPGTIFNNKAPLADFLSLEPFATSLRNFLKQKNPPKFDAADSALATLKAIKALSELCSDDIACQRKISNLGALSLLRRFLLGDDYEKLAANATYAASNKSNKNSNNSESNVESGTDNSSIRVPPAAHVRRHAARLLTILSTSPSARNLIKHDKILCKWLDDCATGQVQCNDLKLQSYCRSVLLNVSLPENPEKKSPQFGDGLFFLNPEMPQESLKNQEENKEKNNRMQPTWDVVFVHGLRGGPFNSWRISDNKCSTTSKAGLVENIDQDAGKEGTCWPREWLAMDFPHGRFFTVKYKTNLTDWTGASLPLQEVSSMLLRRLLAAGIGTRPVVFVTHSMGGLVVKQMLFQAKLHNHNEFLQNTAGLVFYSCPHFGSKLADMPWRMGFVLRPAPSVGELRSGSPRLMELNDFIRNLNNKGSLDVLSFSETQVTPIVEGYGGWALRMEIVPIESAYPGFGELVVLDATDHVNSCKPLNKSDPSYAETLEFLKKLKSQRDKK
ncbi:alpha/beta-Hydrolases superfamily protein [Rhynchospora pubera]|uniref:Alpha/beta-Hydrolases superfamily protein n=1 Tax=Rhynchospora pubera TaxID=906938 RepID=A0AAV8C4N2_9POAL|nr:alpha/beta-Hydrolases superfamily protein [Rhynchospora pubera]